MLIFQATHTTGHADNAKPSRLPQAETVLN
jgi:hypothetical protein